MTKLLGPVLALSLLTSISAFGKWDPNATMTRERAMKCLVRLGDLSRKPKDRAIQKWTNLKGDNYFTEQVYPNEFKNDIVTVHTYNVVFLEPGGDGSLSQVAGLTLIDIKGHKTYFLEIKTTDKDYDRSTRVISTMAQVDKTFSRKLGPEINVEFLNERDFLHVIGQSLNGDAFLARSSDSGNGYKIGPPYLPSRQSK